MTEDEFEDRLAGLSPDQLVEARASLDELADAVEAASMIEGHILALQARLAGLANETVSRSASANAHADARRSMAGQVALAMRIHPSSASAQLATAEQVADDYPETLESVRAGKSSRAHADRLTQLAKHIKSDRTRARDAFRREHGHLPEHGWTAPVSGEVDGADPLEVAASDRRTMHQLRTDLLIDLLLGATPTGQELLATGDGSSLSDVRASVQVTIPVSQLIDPDAGAGWVGDGALISPDTVRIVAGNTAGWERIFIRPDDGTIAAVDHYRPTAAQRRALIARDMACRFPGCRVPAGRCDVDHGHDYARGGRTELSNLEALYPAHHQMKHQDQWRIRQVGGGVIELTPPPGRS